MDEYIGFDEALDFLFQDTEFDEYEKLEKLFSHYFRRRVNLYIEFYGYDKKYGFLCSYAHSEQVNIAGFHDRSPTQLNGYFQLSRDDCMGYFKAYLDSKKHGEWPLYDYKAINRVKDIDGTYWSLRDIEKEDREKGPVYYLSLLYPEINELILCKKEVIALTEFTINQKNKLTNTSNQRPAKSEGYAKNREEVLGAALSVLAQYRDQCVTSTGTIKGAKIAKLVIDKATLFWPSTHEPPLESETIPKIINEWLKKTQG